MALAGLGLVSQTFDRFAASGGTADIDGQVDFTSIGLIAGDIVTNITIAIVVAGVGTTLSKVGLYDSAGNRLALSADQGSVWNTIGLYTIPMITPYQVTASGLYYIAMVAKTGATMPGKARSGMVFPATTGLAIGASAKICGLMAGQTDLPASATIVAGTSRPQWAGVS